MILPVLLRIAIRWKKVFGLLANAIVALHRLTLVFVHKTTPGQSVNGSPVTGTSLLSPVVELTQILVTSPQN